MPHVLVTGPVSLEEAAAALGAQTTREEGVILRTQHAYLGMEGASLLVEGTVVEAGKPAPMLALITRRDDGLMVRLADWTTAERTPGVHRFVAWLGRRIQGSKPGLGFGVTNLDAYLAAAPHA